jgi:2-furoyl-CoA dehydrogenase FAD binding subunit
MKPAAFDYARPDTRRETLALLAESGADGRILAGGQSLMAVLNMRLAQPRLLIDISALAELDYIREHDGQVAVGAAVRQSSLLGWTQLGERLPLLAQALPHVGHFQTRNRGTVCGSIAHADPSAELPLCLATLGGEVVLESARGRRVLPASEFFQGVLMTARRDDELVIEARFPAAVAGCRYAFAEVSMRHGDFAIVALAVVARGAEVRLGVGGVADRPVVTTLDAADDLPAQLNTLAWRLGAQDDQHASAAYRRQLVRELGLRLIREACA